MKRREKIIRLLPLPAKRMAKMIRFGLDPVYVSLYRRRTGFEGAVPPGAVRARGGILDVAAFVEAGARAADELGRALDRVGRRWSDFESVLDFGCGAGRVLTHVAERGEPGTRFQGSDVDRGAIEWARKHQPGASWSVNRSEPPLPFEDGSFDLVYSISVFTHLDEQLQLRWLTELARVLRSGGLALLTTHGEYALGEYESGRVVSNSRDCARRMALHGSLRNEKFVHEPYARSIWTGPDFPGTDPAFGLAFHSEEYIRQRWAQIFDVLAIVPRGLDSWQDIVVLRSSGFGA
jgi:SAM-dependent methyltransferase